MSDGSNRSSLALEIRGQIRHNGDVQIDANIPNFLIQESIYKSRDFFDEIVKEPFEWENGDLIPPTRPGIGIELDEAKLEAHRGKLADYL